MHIAVLSDPNNFHTRKWVTALLQAGARVTVFSYDEPTHDEFPAVRLAAPYTIRGRYNYLSYLRGGKVLTQALQQHGIDLVNALNITPFGVWAMQSGFKPVIQSALGADIFEYPPAGEGSPVLDFRSWSNVNGNRRWVHRKRHQLLRRYYRRLVARALNSGQLVTGDNQHLLNCMHNWFEVPREKMELLRWGIEEKLFQVDAGEIEKLRTKLGLRPDRMTLLSPRGAKAVYQGDIIFQGFRKLLADPELPVQCIMLSAGYAIDASLYAAARALAETDNRFVFVDHALPREQVYALWNLVDVFVSAPIYDGYSASVAEGRFAGAIPVVNDIPATRELFQHGENGWICHPFTPDQLAADLKSILDDLPALKEKFGAVNRQWILAHSRIDGRARDFLEWAEKLLKNP